MENTPSPHTHTNTTQKKKSIHMNILTFFPSWFLPITLLVFLPSIFIYTIRRKTSIKLPPGPRGLPVIGNIHQVLGNVNVHQTLWNLSQKYGPTMLLHLGTQPFLFISSSETAAEVLRTHDQKMCTRPYSEGAKRLTFNYMDAAFSPHGDHWREMRKVLVSEFLGAKRCRLYRSFLEIEMEGVVRSLTSDSLSNRVVNLDDMLLNLVEEVVCKVTLSNSYRGKTFNGRTLKEVIDETAVMLGGSFSDIFPSFGWILNGLSGWNRRLDKCFSDFDSVSQMILDEHLHQKETKTSDREKDFVDDCISRLSSDEIKALLLNVFNGAIDTSVTTMVWAMSEIIKHPRVMQKLQDEIRSCVGKKSMVHESDITNMSYLKMAVKETLRLHPSSTFLMPRECVSRCQIGGYDVLPGTRVIVNAWGIGRDPRIWKEGPTEFIPERFENIQVDFGGKHFEIITFGGGRRACPGYNLAISTIEFTIANLLYLFNWETPGGMKNKDLNMEEYGYPVVRKKAPLCLIPINYNLQD